MKPNASACASLCLADGRHRGRTHYRSYAEVCACTGLQYRQLTRLVSEPNGGRALLDFTPQTLTHTAAHTADSWFLCRRISALTGSGALPSTDAAIGRETSGCFVDVILDDKIRTARPSAPRPGISTADVTTDTVVTTGVMSSPNSTAPSSSGVETGASVGLVGAVLFLIVIIIIIIIRNRKGKCQHDPETTTGDDGVSMVSEDVDITRPKTNVTEMVSSIYRDTDYKTRYRKSSCISDPDMRALVEEMLIDPKRLTLGGIIGKGQFGCVYEATLAKDARSSNDYGSLTHEKVAVKTIRGESCEVDVIEAFLREGMIMREFRHENVLTLIGVAMGRNGLPMIVLPHMGNGNLKTYIANPTLQVTVRELVQFGVQVAHGMQYLSLHKFVHRDLAARNCMLDEQMTVKVADFGLSRDIYTKDYYSSSDRQAMLPVKWMALESLVHSVYTTKSDVWSFGVLLWELLTRGTTPYPDVSNWDIRQYVQSGRRLHQPESCPDDLYALMKKCWSAEPIDRPSFADIVQQLEEILQGEDDDDDDKEETTSIEHNYANLDAAVDVYIAQSSPLDSPGSGLLGPHYRSDSSSTGEQIESPGTATDRDFATTVEHADVNWV